MSIVGEDNVRPVKLSELDEGVMIFRDGDNRIYEVCELKDEILMDDGEDHHEFGGWYTAKEMTWNPDIRSVLEDYIVNHYEDGNMYEGWVDRALDAITTEGIGKVEEVLSEMFCSVSEHYEADKPVEVDVFPVCKDTHND